MIKLIIFDIGDVLIDFKDEQYVDYITDKLCLNKAEFSAALKPLRDDMERGACTLREAEAALTKKFKVSRNSLEWVTTYRKIARRDNYVFRLLTRLSKRYKIALLSNVGRARYIESLRLLKDVPADAVFASCYLKMRKPEHKIYRYVLEKMEVKPNEAVFIDNMKENVVAAEEVGIKSIQFIDYWRLVMDLRRLKIL
jgi:putative hydrolase of the HAD superfamily